MLSDKLIELRQRKGITQTELSKILNIRQNTYSQYENRNRMPDYTILIKIADYYKVSIDYLLEHKSKETTIQKIEKILNDEQKAKLEQMCKVMFTEEYKKIKDAE